MERRHFLERLEHENDYQKEYKKLELFCDTIRPLSSMYSSINEFIEQYFWDWEDRGTFASFAELREYMGFAIETNKGKKQLLATEVDINGYFLFCEMILTLLSALGNRMDPGLYDVKNAMHQTMLAVVENAGFEFRTKGREICVIEKNAAATEVADKIPELADVIIEYNHYLLRGNLDKKRLLLKQIADALEPKRMILNKIDHDRTDIFFDLVNNMNIRHNNLDPTDAKKYNAVFASYTSTEQEEWYDLIYEQALMLFVSLEQQDRDKKINTYKQSRTNGNK